MLEAIPALLGSLLPGLDPVTKTLGFILLLGIFAWALYRFVRRTDAAAIDVRWASVNAAAAEANKVILTNLQNQFTDLNKRCEQCDEELKKAEQTIQRLHRLVNHRTDQRNAARLYWGIYADKAGAPTPSFEKDTDDQF